MEENRRGPLFLVEHGSVERSKGWGVFFNKSKKLSFATFLYYVLRGS